VHGGFRPEPRPRNKLALGLGLALVGAVALGVLLATQGRGERS
jgi:hypothetical protein